MIRKNKKRNSHFDFFDKKRILKSKPQKSLEGFFGPRNLAISRCSQEEMVGFVLIVVLVIIVGVILLGISLRRSTPSTNSAELDNFLEASMLSTTECAVNFVPNYKSLQELIISCWESEKCLNNKTSCEMLNKTINDMLKIAYPRERYSGYNLEIFYAINQTELKQEILASRIGNCSLGTGGEKVIPSYPGDIITRLEVCLA